MSWAAALALAYLIGAVPCGFLIAKSLTGEDVRASGSGSTGATNVVRKAGLAAGLLTYVLDVLKGFLALWVAAWVSGSTSPRLLGAAGLAAVLGHMFPVYLGLRGGKGVATGVGVFLVLSPVATLLALLTWGLVFALTRTVSLGSLLGVLVLPIGIWLCDGWWLGRASEVWLPSLIWAVAIGTAIIARHGGNLQRLYRGTESTFRQTGWQTPPDS
ncbi:glycerol-3-phosphate 1-O-acyltransferase PlsY [Chloracidobacterium validum]|uniref:Glycerol-3-phosphate acyltransferase n=1 Tax=Chloracidobacterium validum TaxID=2821543 RepID=A0ABX8BBB9_9BACT|nr:glycerol-3-phosphate 1-O-acyltransferase PlsY [Chloracidobacterium validum]QUW04226.1 glycerol-3-phosphate 1-O-acyltransferase PlsY [Chloracidobacterium validum]